MRGLQAFLSDEERLEGLFPRERLGWSQTLRITAVAVGGRALGFPGLWWEAVIRDAAMGYLFINLCTEIVFDTGGCPAVNVCLNKAFSTTWE